MPIGIYLAQRIVPYVGIEIKTLRIIKLRIRNRLFLGTLVGRHKPAHRRRIVAGIEVVVAGFCVSFFAGEVVAGGHGFRRNSIKLRVPPVPRFWGPGRRVA